MDDLEAQLGVIANAELGVIANAELGVIANAELGVIANAELGWVQLFRVRCAIVSGGAIVSGP